MISRGSACGAEKLVMREEEGVLPFSFFFA